MPRRRFDEPTLPVEHRVETYRTSPEALIGHIPTETWPMPLAKKGRKLTKPPLPHSKAKQQALVTSPENPLGLIEIKQRYDLTLLLRILTGSQQGMAVVERKTNELLTAGNDLLIANGTGFR